MPFKNSCLLLLILIAGETCLCAQNRIDTLFGSQVPLQLSLKFSIKSIRNSKEDSTYISHRLYYRNTSGLMDSIQADLKGRGNFRLKECYFPPLWIKIKKSEAKGTLFEGNKKLKLVLPCNTGESANILILKEFLCYKLYEEISPYSFQTRLADVALTEDRGRKTKSFTLKGILIEDLDKIAGRLQAKPLKNVKISPAALNDTSTLQFELFQFMISNTDWSAVYQHNTKLIVQEPGKFISLIYDFDMSGLVNAPYAVVSEINGEQLNAKRVTERIYRGYCHSPELMQCVRKEFLSKETRLLSIPDELNGELSDREIKGIKKFMGEFFDILKDDHLFQADILDKCRAK